MKGFLLFLLVTGAPAWAQARVVQSVIPSLAASSSCWSVVEVQNLGTREVAAEVEAHTSSGALASFVAHRGIQIRLRAGEHAEFRFQPSGEINGAWVRIRETVPVPELSPVLALSAATECLVAGELHSTLRDSAWPTRNPWYSGDVRPDDDGVLAITNTSERPAPVRGCYASGVFFSVPDGDRPAGELTTVCSEIVDEVVPPFGSRQFPVSRGGNLRFSLATEGDAIVLQMLRPAGANIKAYRVDSSITFGKEVP